MKKIFLALSLFSLTFVACKKDPVEPTPTPTPTPAATTGSLKMEFEAIADSTALVFDTKNYINANQDTFTVSMFKYYVSNVVLTKSDNSTHAVTGGYYLVDHRTTGSNIITFTNVPVGSYKSVKFLLGVDSLRNVSGAQEGALAVSNGMFWSWNSGYIFAKMEGNSSKSTASGNKLMYHVGGFKGATNALRNVTISFGSETANVSGTVTPELHLTADVQKFFKGTHTISFASMNTVHMPGTNAMKVADNYSQMFTLEHIHN